MKKHSQVMCCTILMNSYLQQVRFIQGATVYFVVKTNHHLAREPRKSSASLRLITLLTASNNLIVSSGVRYYENNKIDLRSWNYTQLHTRINNKGNKEPLWKEIYIHHVWYSFRLKQTHYLDRTTILYLIL